MTQSAIDEAVDDPFLGFNLGAVQFRPNIKSRPGQHYFEGPLVRLMTDHEYRDVYEQGRVGPPDSSRYNPHRTVWIFRYYDESSTHLSEVPVRLDIEDAATRLYDLIGHVLRVTGAKKVHLVAHSMGGLICRSVIQKTFPENRRKPSDVIARFFTYATPHGGIHFRPGLGVFAAARDFLGTASADVFGPDRMYSYLTPGAKRSDRSPPGFDPQRIRNDEYPLEDIFCLVGTNARDYSVLHGGSSLVIGPDSDGLVQIDRASIHGAASAYTHHSHSGRFGIVNSEVGYRHLEGFLLGTVAVRVLFHYMPSDLDPDRRYYIDVKTARYGDPILFQERTRAHFCPIPVSAESKDGRHVTEVVATFNLDLPGKSDRALLYAEIAIHAPKVEKIADKQHQELNPQSIAGGLPNLTRHFIARVVGGNDPVIETENNERIHTLKIPLGEFSGSSRAAGSLLKGGYLDFECRPSGENSIKAV